jgi:hypothetical protein
MRSSRRIILIIRRSERGCSVKHAYAYIMFVFFCERRVDADSTLSKGTENKTQRGTRTPLGRQVWQYCVGHVDGTHGPAVSTLWLGDSTAAAIAQVTKGYHLSSTYAVRTGLRRGRTYCSHLAATNIDDSTNTARVFVHTITAL